MKAQSLMHTLEVPVLPPVPEFAEIHDLAKVRDFRDSVTDMLREHYAGILSSHGSWLSALREFRRRIVEVPESQEVDWETLAAKIEEVEEGLQEQLDGLNTTFDDAANKLRMEGNGPVATVLLAYKEKFLDLLGELRASAKDIREVIVKQSIVREAFKDIEASGESMSGEELLDSLNI